MSTLSQFLGPAPVYPTPRTTAGLSIGKLISAASTNATSLKASAGMVYSVYAFNANANTRYLKVYNKASAPTVGSDVPAMTLPIPGNFSGFMLTPGGHGIEFTTGIAYATTQNPADADATAVAANEIIATILYK